MGRDGDPLTLLPLCLRSSTGRFRLPFGPPLR